MSRKEIFCHANVYFYGIIQDKYKEKLLQCKLYSQDSI